MMKCLGKSPPDIGGISRGYVRAEHFRQSLLEAADELENRAKRLLNYPFKNSETKAHLTHEAKFMRELATEMRKSAGERPFEKRPAKKD